jgi:hypothetical protein
MLLTFDRLSFLFLSSHYSNSSCSARQPRPSSKADTRISNLTTVNTSIHNISKSFCLPWPYFPLFLLFIWLAYIRERWDAPPLPCTLLITFPFFVLRSFQFQVLTVAHQFSSLLFSWQYAYAQAPSIVNTYCLTPFTNINPAYCWSFFVLLDTTIRKKVRTDRTYTMLKLHTSAWLYEPCWS